MGILSMTERSAINTHPICRDLPQTLQPINDTNEPYYVTIIVLIVFGLIQIIVGHSLFLYYRTSYQQLKKRNYAACVLVSAGVIAQLVAGPITSLKPTPSWLFLALAQYLPPLLALPAALIFLDFLIRYTFASLMNGNTVLANDEDILEDNGVVKGVRNALGEMMKSTGKVMKNQKAGKTSVVASSTSPAIGKVSIATLKTLKKWSTWKYQVPFILTLMAPTTIVIIINYATFQEYRYCVLFYKFSWNNYFLLGMAAVYISFMAIGAYACRSLPDPFAMINQIRWYALFGLGLLGSYAVTSIAGNTNFIIAQTVFTFFMQSITVDYQVFKALTNKVENSQKKNNERVMSMQQTDASGITSLTINSPSLPWENYPEFEEYVTSEFSSELLKFFQEVNRFEIEFPDKTQTTRLARARKIYKLYIEPSALLEVNLPYTIREEISKNLENSAISASIFRTAKREVRLMLEGIYRRFESKHPEIANVRISKKQVVVAQPP